MPKEEIVEGLRIAVSKGESLERAMMTFYNAGYTKEDIEEAASTLQFLLSPRVQPPQIIAPKYAKQTPAQPPTPPAAQQKPQQPQPQTPQQIQIYYHPIPNQQNAQPQRVIQRVSEYSENYNRTGTAVTIILIFLLIALLGVLASVFLFKEELADFFNRVLGFVISE